MRSQRGLYVAAVRSHRGAIYSKVSDVVDEASVSYVDE